MYEGLPAAVACQDSHAMMEAQEFDACFSAVFLLALRKDNSVLQWSMVAGAFGLTKKHFCRIAAKA
jgi:hypothetical protein